MLKDKYNILQNAYEQPAEKLVKKSGELPDVSDATEDTSETTTSGNRYNEMIDAITGDNKADISEPGNANSEGYTNTGSGIESTIGGYSWETLGKDKADLQYQQDVLSAKQEALANRQTIEQNSKQYQTQADMLQYTNNQSAQSGGWTGGTVLDQNRQMEYLKQSINAQMYGAMELQKYGYDTSLAAARLSYDLNQQEFAHQYYQDAITTALSEANVTGIYFSPEVKDMLSQYSLAQDNLKKTDLTEAEKAKAEQLSTKIESWFSENKISKEGIKAASVILQERQFEYEKAKNEYEMFLSIKDKITEEMKTNSSLFIQLDDDGNPVWDGADIKTGDWNTMSADQMIEYFKKQDGEINENKKQEFYNYIDTNIASSITTSFQKYCEDKNFTTNLPQRMQDYLNNSDELVNFIEKKFNNATEENKLALINSLDGYNIVLELPDGKSYNYILKYDEETKKLIREQTVTGTSTNPEDKYIPDKNDFKEVIEELNYSSSGNAEDSLFNKFAQIEIPDNASPKDVISYVLGEIGAASVGTAGAATAGATAVGAVAGATAGATAGAAGVAAGTAGVATGATLGATGAATAVAAACGPVLLAIGGALSLIDTFADMGYTQANLEAVRKSQEQLESSANELVTIVGEKNLKLLSDAKNKYENLSDRDKLQLTQEEINNYEYATKFYTNYSTIVEALNNLSNRDSSIFDSNGSGWGSSWDYTGDAWKRTGDLFKDGYQFGDVVGTGVKAIGNVFITNFDMILHCAFKGWLWDN